MRRVFRIPFSRSRIERDIDDEIEFHLHMRTERLMGEGLSREEARRRALEQFGGIPPVRAEMLRSDREHARNQRRVSAFTDLRQDFAFALRTLRRNATFTALVIGGLTLGIGANAAIYSLIDALMIRTLPVAEPDRLVLVGREDYVTSSGIGAPMTRAFSYPLYRDIRDNNRVFDGLLATGEARRLDVKGNGAAPEAEHPHGRFVSGNYFRVLGVRAAVGGTLDPSDDDPAAAPRITISHAYWTRRFGRDPEIVGRTIHVDGVPAVITGVTPEGFTGEVVGSPTDLWIPISLHDRLRPTDALLKSRRASWLLLIGRAKPSLTLEQIRQQLIPLIRNTIYAHATNAELAVFERRPLQYYISSAERGASETRTTFRSPLVTLMVGVGFLLCIVCVNVANLLLARGVARRHEMSLRLALGADRRRILLMVLRGGLWPVIRGVVLGLGAAALVRKLMQMYFTFELSAIDPMAFAVAALPILVAGVAACYLPARRASRVDPNVALRHL